MENKCKYKCKYKINVKINACAMSFRSTLVANYFKPETTKSSFLGGKVHFSNLESELKINLDFVDRFIRKIFHKNIIM